MSAKRWPQSVMPELSHSRALILFPLLNGCELTRVSLCQVIAWQTSNPNFYQQSQNRMKSGFLERFRATVSNGDGTQTEVRYRITDAGRRAVQEVLDFYLFAAEKFGRGGATNGDGSRNERVLFRVTIPPNRNPSKRDRWMTATEQKRLFAICDDSFRRLAVALQELRSLTVSTVGALDVRDFDPETSELVLRSKRAERRQPVSPELAAVIVESIGERTSGPLFPAPRGGRWSANKAGAVFRSLRGAARITTDVMLRGMSYRRKHTEGADLRDVTKME